MLYLILSFQLIIAILKLVNLVNYSWFIILLPLQYLVVFFLSKIQTYTDILNELYKGSKK
jgi:hypothetical protein